MFGFYLLVWLKAVPVFYCFTFLLYLLALSSPPQQFHHLRTASFVIGLASVLETVSFPSLVLSHVQAAEQNQDEPAACCCFFFFVAKKQEKIHEISVMILFDTIDDSVYKVVCHLYSFVIIRYHHHQ